MRARRLLTLLMALALAASPFPVPRAAVALEPLLPDIGMLAPKDFSIQSRPKGVRWLRFDTVVVNVGPGLFEVYGYGPVDGMERPVRQRIQDGAGGWTSFDTQATMFFAGDGHNHWHVRDFQDWTIARVNDPANVLKRGAKTGFCFWDNFPYPAGGRPAVYHPSTTSACMQRTDGTVPMGMSVGWGDEYPSSIAFQYIDISGLPNGDYVVTLEADLDKEFFEADDTNNTSWATIRITRKGVTVLSTGTDLEP